MVHFKKASNWIAFSRFWKSSAAARTSQPRRSRSSQDKPKNLSLLKPNAPNTLSNLRCLNPRASKIF